MNNVIECIGRQAENPFYLEKIELRIYSAEELVYCICENPELIEKAMFTEELSEWLSEECNAKDFSKRVYRLCCQGGNLTTCVKGILEDAGYISAEEMNAVTEVIDKMRGNNEISKCRVRADFFLRKKRFAKAIKELEILIANVNPADRVALAEMYQKRGLAKAGLFLFEQAGEDFLKAYTYDGKKEHYYYYAATLRFRLSEREYINTVSEDPMLSSMSLELEEKRGEAIAAWQQSPEYIEFLEQKTNSEINGKQAFYTWVSEKLSVKKEEYRKLVQ